MFALSKSNIISLYSLGHNIHVYYYGIKITENDKSNHLTINCTLHEDAQAQTTNTLGVFNHCIVQDLKSIAHKKQEFMKEQSTNREYRPTGRSSRKNRKLCTGRTTDLLNSTALETEGRRDTATAARTPGRGNPETETTKHGGAICPARYPAEAANDGEARRQARRAAATQESARQKTAGKQRK